MGAIEKVKTFRYIGIASPSSYLKNLFIILVFYFYLSGCAAVEPIQYKVVCVTFLKSVDRYRVDGNLSIQVPHYIYVDSNGFEYELDLHIGPTGMVLVKK